MDRKVYDYWLYSLNGIGKKTFLKLRNAGIPSEEVYKGQLENIAPFLDKKQVSSIIKGKSDKETDLYERYEKLKQLGIFMTVFGDEDYPKRFYPIEDSPAVLFYRGKLPEFEQKMIAIIGARNCSEYGKYVAKAFATYFAKHNVGVISGMARGIDGYAQMETLKENGYSLAVLGCGVTVCYPEENQILYQKLLEKGGVISEYLPYDKPSPNLFPPRNRIISALADAIIVVEAKEKSGTLITVEMALEQGKEVYVVPGRITDGLSAGCNKLLCEGANLALSPQKVLNALYGEGYTAHKQDKIEILSKEQKLILEFLDVTPTHINVLQDRTKLPIQMLQSELFILTIKGTVIQTMNCWYQKAK